MSTNTEPRPVSVTARGITITVVTYTHDDWTPGYDVEIRDDRGGIAVVPSWRCPDEATARRYANAAYVALRAADDPTALDVRDAAVDAVRLVS